DALMVRVGAEVLAIPVPSVKAALQARPDEIQSFDGAESIEIDGEPVDLARLGRVLRIPSDGDIGPLSIVTLRTGRKTLAVVVDEFLMKEEIVVKSLGGFLQGTGPFSGATVTGEGRVILLLDALKLLQIRLEAPAPRARRPPPRASAGSFSSTTRSACGSSSAACSSAQDSTSSPLATAPRHCSSSRNARSTSSSPIWRCRD